MNRGAAFDCRSRDKDTNISREYKRHAKVYEYRYEVIDPAEKSYGDLDFVRCGQALAAINAFYSA
jgi:hypothetical protein